MNIDIEREVNRRAASQGGHLTRRQLAEAGVAARTVYARSASGLLVAVGQRTFRVGSVPRTARGDVIAACLETGGVASHWTAAWLHGLAPPRPIVDVTVTKGRTLRASNGPGDQPTVRIHSSTNLPPDDVLLLGPIPVTSVARTMLGLAAVVPFELAQSRLFDLVSATVDRDLATDPWLWWLLSQRRCRGRNGVIALEAVLAERARLGPTESWLEREFLRVLDAAGLPLPVTQTVIRRNGRFAARVDFAYEPEMVIMEALGYAFHRSKAQMEADTRRANELQLLGYAVYQFTAEQIVCSPDSVSATARAALASAAQTAA